MSGRTEDPDEATGWAPREAQYDAVSAPGADDPAACSYLLAVLITQARSTLAWRRRP
jgi:hypothetical protein